VTGRVPAGISQSASPPEDQLNTHVESPHGVGSQDMAECRSSHRAAGSMHTTRTVGLEVRRRTADQGGFENRPRRFARSTRRARPGLSRSCRETALFRGEHVELSIGCDGSCRTAAVKFTDASYQSITREITEWWKTAIFACYTGDVPIILDIQGVYRTNAALFLRRRREEVNDDARSA
jgi:hypothetical protein